MYRRPPLPSECWKVMPVSRVTSRKRIVPWASARGGSGARPRITVAQTSENRADPFRSSPACRNRNPGCAWGTWIPQWNRRRVRQIWIIMDL